MTTRFTVDGKKVSLLGYGAMHLPTQHSLESCRGIFEKSLKELRRADHYTGCGRCAPHCPQQIDIPKEIQAIDEVIEVLRAELAK